MRNWKIYSFALICSIVTVVSAIVSYLTGFIWLSEPIVVENGVGRMMDTKELWIYGSICLLTFMLAIVGFIISIKLIKKLRSNKIAA